LGRVRGALAKSEIYPREGFVGGCHLGECVQLFLRLLDDFLAYVFWVFFGNLGSFWGFFT
jgi:hypothetical protein